MPSVLYEQSAARIGLISLNDPDNLNAMGEEMAAEMRALIQKLRTGEKPRVLILTGSGRAFSAGGNLHMLEQKQKLSREENHRRMLEFYHSFLDVLTLQVPLIAAINGHAIGAGLCLASACEVRVASTEAKLGFTFAKLGLHPGMGATYFLPRVCGYPRAAELMITGRVIGAEEALQAGLVSRVVPPAEVLSAARSVADEILSCGPEAVMQLLQSLRGEPGALEAALEREASCQSINYAGKEFAEGLAATREKRRAHF